MLLRLANFFFSRLLFVDADDSDNTFTLSPLLLRFILQVCGLGENRAFVFRISSHGEYAFVLNPDFSEESVTSPIQWNTKLGCAGFASYCPSVNRIFYDYGLSRSVTSRIFVKIRRICGKYIFILKNPL